MRRAWSFTGRTPEARESMARFAAAYPELNLGAMEDLRDLVTALEVTSTRPREERWHIANKMLVESADPQIAAALVQTLLPGIMRECERMHWGKGIAGVPEQMLGQAVVSATEIVHRWAGEERDYAMGDVLNATRSRVRDWMMREKQIARGLNVDATALARVRPAPDSDRLVARLESFMGTPQERVARLTAARLYDRTPQHELAAEAGLSTRHLDTELRNFALDHLLE